MGDTEIPPRLSDTQKGILALMARYRDPFEWWTARSIMDRYNFFSKSEDISKRTSLRSVQRLENRDLVEISRYEADVSDPQYPSNQLQAHKIKLTKEGLNVGREIWRRITDGRYSLSVIET